MVAARIYSRLFITKAPGFDDLLITIALVFGIALSALIGVGVNVYKINRHVWDIPITLFSGSRLNVWICEWCYITASCTVKISILLFYRRLSGNFSKIFLVATWSGIVYNMLYMFVCLVLLLVECKPVSAYWLAFDPAWVKEGHTYKCLSPGESLTLPMSGAFSVLGDFYSTALPLCLVYSLDLPRRQKIALYGLFALGFFVVLAGIFRTVALNKVINETYDFTWTLWKMWIWTVMELYFAIFAASAPALKPFFLKFFIEPMATMSENTNGHGPPRIFSRRRSEKSLRQQPGEGRARLWSTTDASTTARNSNAADDDAEKMQMGVVLSRIDVEMAEHGDCNCNGTEHAIHTPYNHHFSLARKDPITTFGINSLDLGSGLDRNLSYRSTTSASAFLSACTSPSAGRDSSDYILPPIKTSDTDTLRQYRAEIEVLPPLPSPRQLSVRSLKRALDVNADDGIKIPRTRPSKRELVERQRQINESDGLAARTGSGAGAGDDGDGRRGSDWKLQQYPHQRADPRLDLDPNPSSEVGSDAGLMES